MARLLRGRVRCRHKRRASDQKIHRAKGGRKRHSKLFSDLPFFCSLRDCLHYPLTKQPLYSDAELAELIRNSDANAFRTLFERFIRALVYFGVKLTGDQQESEDAASEAFQKLWQKREDMRGFPEMRAYLFSIVHNRSVNFVKRRSMMK